jgi:hypothetical protein
MTFTLIVLSATIISDALHIWISPEHAVNTEWLKFSICDTYTNSRPPTC